jgi:hypothetical protein
MTVVPASSGSTRTMLTRSSETSTAAGRLVARPRKKSRTSSRKVSPVLAIPCPSVAGRAPTVRSSTTVSGVARTVIVVVGSGAGVERTRTSAGIGSAPSASPHDSSTRPKTPPPPPAPGRAVIGTSL